MNFAETFVEFVNGENGRFQWSVFLVSGMTIEI
jgi:hypothetical protein